MSVKKALLWIFLLLKQCMSILCCGGTFNNNTGVITSPNYPDNYNDGDNCVWRITVDSGKTITLTFSDFHLEAGNVDNVDYYDYVEIRDGYYNFSVLIGRYYGELIPDSITTTGNSIYVAFVSDSTSTYSGFRSFWDTGGICTFCSWSSWISYGPCNGICGGGSRTRLRSLCCRSDFDLDSCLSNCSLDLIESYSTSVCTRKCNNGGTDSGTMCLCRPGYTGTCCNTVKSIQTSTRKAATTTKTTATTKPIDAVPTRKLTSLTTTPNDINEPVQSNSTTLTGVGGGSGILVLVIIILIVVAVLLKSNINNDYRVSSPANDSAVTSMYGANVDIHPNESIKQKPTHEATDLENTEEDENAYSYADLPVKMPLTTSTEYNNLRHANGEMSELIVDTKDTMEVGSEDFQKSDLDGNYYYS